MYLAGLLRTGSGIHVHGVDADVRHRVCEQLSAALEVRVHKCSLPPLQPVCVGHTSSSPYLYVFLLSIPVCVGHTSSSPYLYV